MALTVNVRDGTPKHDGKRLCDSCQNGFVAVTSSGKEFVFCQAIRRDIHSKITECSDYKHLKEKDEYELAPMAWILEVKNGKSIGFKPPKKRGND